MKISIKLTIALLITTCIQSCAVQNLDDYSIEQPSFELDKFFNGNTTGWGIVQDRSGSVTRRFVVEIVGKFNGDKGTLDEQFKWSNGDTEERIWRLEKVSDDQWIGYADDVVGKAIGKTAGNALKWEYTLSLKLDEGSINVKFDDWMYLVDEKVLMNKAKFSKFGLFLGEVTLAFIKTENL